MNIMWSKSKEYFFKGLAFLALIAASFAANSCCSLMFYEPPMPDAVKKLKKK